MKKAIALFMPVIHRGYIEFLDRYPDADIFVIGEDIIDDLEDVYPQEVKSVARDQRRLCCDDILMLLSFIKFDQEVNRLLLSDLTKIQSYDEVIMPEDTFHRVFMGEFGIPNQKYSFVNCFLRWDRNVSINKVADVSDGVITINELRHLGLLKFVNQAKEVALKSPDWWRQVGSVLVRDNQTVLTAFNTHLPNEQEIHFSGDPRANFDAGEYIDVSVASHSEAEIIATAARKGIVTDGCEIFVTTLPCPPCSYLIARSGIKRVYFIEGYSMNESLKVFKDYGVELIQIVG